MSSNDPIKLTFKVNDQDTVIKGRDCLNALAFKTEGAIMELMPKNPAKPQKGSQHMFRSEEGYITIWSNNHKHIDKFKLLKEHNTGRHQTGTVQTIQYMLVSVDDGPLFIPSMKNYRKILYPLFKDCDGMDKGGFSDFFSGLIRLSKSYNEVCSSKK